VLSGGVLNKTKGDLITVHEGIIKHKDKIYVGTQENWRIKVIQSLHNSSISGHSRILGTYYRVKLIFIGPN
jgi:hypothetical protein